MGVLGVPGVAAVLFTVGGGVEDRQLRCAEYKYHQVT